jgi:hypothetical protein
MWLPWVVVSGLVCRAWLRAFAAGWGQNKKGAIGDLIPRSLLAPSSSTDVVFRADKASRALRRTFHLTLRQ